MDLYPLVLTQSISDALPSRDDKGHVQVDNFYLDMNGIIHTCTHANNDKLMALNEKEMFQRIFSYTDRLYKLVRPSTLMFLAVDGVAPRAKMNQQRSRRFRSSKEREVLISEFVAKEGKLPDEESFDSNCITPGTEFMYRLGIAFRRWIIYKMQTDPFWRDGAEVVFSGPDVPGEGEHKVMDMIRKHKAEEIELAISDPDYLVGKKRHCMYGLDADLIMLSLVTHEPHFVLLREKQSTRKQKKDAMLFGSEDFEILEISILRKMLEQHFRKMAIEMDEIAARNEARGFASTRFDLERIIDDFVFMCFFVGNDFLPCLPHLDIADGSLNLMMNIYRDLLPKMGGYLTNKADIHLNRVEVFIQEIGRREPLYFQQRAIDEKDEAYAGDLYKANYYRTKFGTDSSCEKKEDNEPPSGLKEAYLQGLVWVLNYYHFGCSSWTWYYPHLYAPLSTDMKSLAEININFEQGSPFTPLLQLLSVLPPQSGKLLPSSYSKLMTDEASPLVEYYPSDFEVDPNGKKNSWEYIVKIPFITESDLLSAVSKIDHKMELTEAERIRNLLGEVHHFSPQKFGVIGRNRLSKSLVNNHEGLGPSVGNALLDSKVGGKDEGTHRRNSRGRGSGANGGDGFRVRRRY